MRNAIIIVPYRNRVNHFSAFMRHMQTTMPNIDICIIEQADDGKSFNRAKLLNIGFLENQNYEYYIFHDIDMLPMDDYIGQPGITQLAKSNIQPYEYLGGVTMFDKHTFEYVGGYNNEYFHRAEDNEMRFNLKRLHVPVRIRYANFEFLDHEKSGPDFIPELWVKSQKPRKNQNQLSVCEYKVTYCSHLTHTVNCKTIIKHLIAEI